MCSISTNRTADECLDELEQSGERRRLEKRLFQIADEANTTQSGALENPGNIMRRMPLELRIARKFTFGRHRVYYTGRNTDCAYKVFFIKTNKKDGVDPEDDKRFQRKLIKALNEAPTRVIEQPEDSRD